MHPVLRTVLRSALAAGLVWAGVAHLTRKREEFQAQVPDFVPLEPDTTVLLSGFVEIGLGSAILAVPAARRAAVGRIAAAFFAAVLPGNIAQWRHRRDGFGLDTDTKRFVRLLLQPLLVAWALAATGPHR